MKRRVYLAMKELEEARELFFSRMKTYNIGTEEISIEASPGRVTAAPVFANFSAPSYHSAAMDGIAVRAQNTYGTSERSPKILKMGKEARWINTGQLLPEGFDAVIMIEKVHQLGEEHVEIRSPAFPWQHVRKVGEDIVATQLLLPQNHKIRPVDLGALISGGVFRVKVWNKPKVTIIPTGSELIHPKDIQKGILPEKGQIIEYNSVVLGAMVKECGGIPEIHKIVPDDQEKIKKALLDAVDSDSHIVIINAGSSAGSRDYTVHLIEKLGEVIVHGVAMMPGKPTILGFINNKPVIGNPGYSVSSVLSFDQFVKPVLYRLQGQEPPEPEKIYVKPTTDIPSKLGIQEFLRVNIGKVREQYVATPLPRAAGSITTLTRAEGIIRIPSLSEGISQKEEVETELLVQQKEILNTVVFIGSHDITIDILSDEIRKKGQNIRISSSNVGSLGGLIALKKGRCHLSGSHLLDTETGEYNLSYIKRYLKGVPVAVYHLVLRDQGLIVAKGNPKGIKGLEDLTRDDVSFVNRQAGSGTRVLLDYRLEQHGIDPEQIHGYDHEEFTHMAVAVDVLSGAADCGLGIYAAAKALGLDFVPMEQEQYDLIIPTDFLDDPNIEVIIKTIGSESFKERVMALGGYDPTNSGVLWKIIS